MKYLYPFGVDPIIHDFDRVAMSIESHQQIFILIIFQKTISYRMQ